VGWWAGAKTDGRRKNRRKKSKRFDDFENLMVFSREKPRAVNLEEMVFNSNNGQKFR